MKKINLFFAGALMVLLMTGCQSGTDNVAKEAQEQQESAIGEESTVKSVAGFTTDTLDDLTTQVEDFVAEVENLVEGNNHSSTEQFHFAKQRASEIDDALDRYEDELEKQISDGSLSGDDYQRMEDELDTLEDRLDDAEDQLEDFFGIDD